MEAIVITKENFEEQVLRAEKPVLVDFCALVHLIAGVLPCGGPGGWTVWGADGGRQGECGTSSRSWQSGLGWRPSPRCWYFGMDRRESR